LNFGREFAAVLGLDLGLAMERLQVFAPLSGMARTPQDGGSGKSLDFAALAAFQRNSAAPHIVAIGFATAIVRADLGRRCGGRRRCLLLPRSEAPSMLISPAFAQAASPFGGDNLLVSLLPFVLIFVIMYFLILRPQQRRVKQHQEMVKNVRRGDTVVTSGGLVAKVTKVIDDDKIEIEVADGVRAVQMRSMVADVRAKGEPVKEDASS
jgi:preprotein translocase subunit YajC